eukprot:UN34381
MADSTQTKKCAVKDAHGSQFNPPTKEWSDKLDRVLYSADDIQKRVKEMGAQISKDYGEGEQLLVIGMLRGAFVFLADLCRNISLPVQVDFMTVSSYSGTHSTGSVLLKKDVEIDPRGKHVLIVEDIVDTGTTLKWLTGHLKVKIVKV